MLVAYALKNIIVEIISGLLMFIVFGAGYLLSTIGVLGLAFILNDLAIDREMRLNNEITYKQYHLGNALSNYDLIEVSIYKKTWWLSGIEKKIATKKYDVDVTNNIGIVSLTRPNTLHSYNFKVKHIASKKEVILLETLKGDTIVLK